MGVRSHEIIKSTRNKDKYGLFETKMFKTIPNKVNSSYGASNIRSNDGTNDVSYCSPMD